MEFEASSDQASMQALGDYKWDCKHCKQSVRYTVMNYHLRRNHFLEFEASTASVRSHFTRGELNAVDPKRKPVPKVKVTGYKWSCNYCTKEVPYTGLSYHLRDVHFDKFEGSTLPIISHFTRGELLSSANRKTIVKRQRAVSDYKWKCNRCDKEVAYSNLKGHLFSVAHRNDDIQVVALGSSLRNHFTRGDLINFGDLPTSYFWKCNYCAHEVSYPAMEAHLRSKRHQDDENIVIESTKKEYLARYHFTRGQLRSFDAPDAEPEGELEVEKGNRKRPRRDLRPKPSDETEVERKIKRHAADYKWNCNHCDRSLVYGSFKSHMIALHKNEYESSNLTASDHFTRGELRRKQSESKPLTDFKWNCHYCDHAVSYASMKRHLLYLHKDEFESSKLAARNHFSQGELRLQDKSIPKQVIDFKWNCRHCDNIVSYKNRKRHLRTAHRTEFESDLPVSAHFRQGELATTYRRKNSPDYKWVCKHCEKEVGYWDMRQHLKVHKYTIGSSSYRIHFNRGDLIVRDEHQSKDVWKCNYCASEVAYESMTAHLRSKKHRNDRSIPIQATKKANLAKEHFSRIELEDKRSSDGNLSSEEDSGDDNESIISSSSEAGDSDDEGDLTDGTESRQAESEDNGVETVLLSVVNQCFKEVSSINTD